MCSGSITTKGVVDMKTFITMLIAAAMSIGFGAAALAGSCGGGDHKHDKCACGYEKGSDDCKSACSKDKDDDDSDSSEESTTEKAAE